MPTCFFDTNVLVYTLDAREPAKQARARELVMRHSQANEACISTQVLIELYNVLTRRLRIPAARAAAVVSACMAWPVIESDLALVSSAVGLATRHQVSIFDAMMVEAAQRSGATTLYSEDMQHGRHFGSLTLVNPFA